MKYLISNWKANKTIEETIKWFKELTSFDFSKTQGFEVIVFTPFISLPIAKEEIKNNKLMIKLGAENVFHFEDGSYTGAVTAKMLNGVVEYVLIGHSETRKFFNETDDLIIKKTILSINYNLIPIICVSNLDQVIFWEKETKDVKNRENSLFLYEPLEAIGSGNPKDPEKLLEIVKKIKEITGNLPVLYGGSVTAENINTYLKIEDIDGAAIGKASLDPKSFINILNNVSKI